MPCCELSAGSAMKVASALVAITTACQTVPESGCWKWKPRLTRSASLKAAPLAEAELAEYCRRKGIFVEHIRRWRQEVRAALAYGDNGRAAERAQDKKRIRELEKDLRRKEKALAETAALLVLSRKYEALGTDGEDA
jgi:transposase